MHPAAHDLLQLSNTTHPPQGAQAWQHWKATHLSLVFQMQQHRRSSKLVMPSTVRDSDDPAPMIFHLDQLDNQRLSPARRRYHLEMLAWWVSPGPAESVEPMVFGSKRFWPTVSIVIPAYNAQDSIIGSMKSCFHQTYPCLEVVVVNDGSTDKTLSRLQEFDEPLAPGHRLKVVDQANRGVAGARNEGLKNAQGVVVHFLDADDQLHPDAIAQKMKLLMHHPQIDVVYTPFVEIEKTTTGVNATTGYDAFEQLSIDDTRSPVFDFLFATCSRYPFFPSTAMMPIWRVHQAGGFDEQLRQAEDARLWFRLALNGACCAAISQPLTHRRREPDSLTSMSSQTVWFSMQSDLLSLADLEKKPGQARYALALLTRLTWLLDRGFDEGIDHERLQEVHQQIWLAEQHWLENLATNDALLLADQLQLMLESKILEHDDAPRATRCLFFERRQDHLTFIEQRVAEGFEISLSEFLRWLPPLSASAYTALSPHQRPAVQLALTELHQALLHGQAAYRLHDLSRFNQRLLGHPFARLWTMLSQTARWMGPWKARRCFDHPMVRNGWSYLGQLKNALRRQAA